MNKQQTDYAFDRINTIRARKALAFASTLPQAPKSLSFEEQYAEIKNGKAKLKPLADLKSYTDLRDAYVYESDKKRDEVMKANKPKVEAYGKKINAAVQKLKDDIVFIKLEDVQKSIDEFEKAKF